ncbi:tyrosine-protein kinase receptor Tie-1-like isoform X4 [Ptychodera flava]|uniref:tyrosine-protein kinase receptor Tie-1-like isoform X4 n=1 Tax=Ptychodera flava TaxID=63121 RepID=UPI003969D5CA
MADSGIYELYPSDNKTLGGITRVVIRGCRSGRWKQPECDKICPDCQNGGVCDDKSGDCICPPGFIVERITCGENKYGENCDYECNAYANGCGFSQFCLPDPYGCTCATGWEGHQCNEACDVGQYGPDCKLRCDCHNGGTCDRYRGCVCTDGWTGPTCQSQVSCHLTLINSSPIISSASETHLYCVDTSGTVPVTDLSIARALDTGNGRGIPEEASVTADRLEAAWGRETGSARYGVFKCGDETTAESVITLKVFRSDVAPGVISPSMLSMRASVGDNLTVSMSRHKQLSDGVSIVWRHNGQAIDFSVNPSHEQQDVRSFSLKLTNISVTDGGIYELHPSDNRTLGGITRVVVRGCRSGRWKPPECDKICPDCQNGGVCDDKSGDCICPPGFMGATCSVACGENKYGENCDYECDAYANGCGFSQFCLPDPYGCTCATGWEGHQCNEACDVGQYGPDCKLRCDCHNGGTCDRYRGCVCTDGWTGPTCQSQGSDPPVPSNSPSLIAAGPYSLTINPNAEPYIGSGPIEAATVMFKKATENVWSTKPIPSSNLTFYVLQGLDHDTEYKIKIRLAGNGGNGETGPKLIASTTSQPCQALTEGPQPTLTVLGSKSIEVSWEMIESSGVKGYEVAYKEEGGQMYFREVDDPDQTLLVLEGLKPYTVYRIGIAEKNCAGKGPTSALVSIRTRQDAPGPVRNLRLVAHTPDRILVTWDAPAVPNGEISHYELTIYENGVQLRDRIARTTVQENYVLSNLRPYTMYRVVVQAYTIKTGESADAEIRTPEDVPSGPPINIVASNITTDSMTLNWEEPEEDKRNGLISRYDYVFRTKDDSGYRRARSVRGTSETFSYIASGTAFAFKVRAYTSKGPGPYSNEVIAITDQVITSPYTRTIEVTTPAKTATSTLPSAILQEQSNEQTTMTTNHHNQSFEATLSTRQSNQSEPQNPTSSGEVTYDRLPGDDATMASSVSLMHKVSDGDDSSGDVTSAVVMVIGIICGIVLILLLACAVCFMLIKTRNKRRRTQAAVSEPTMRMSELQRQESSNNDYGSDPSGQPPLQTSISIEAPQLLVPAHLDFWRIPWEKIIFEDKILAEGNFGRVMKADIKKDDKTVIEGAVKVLKDGASDVDRKDFIGELEIMCKVGKHPNIVNLIGACEHLGILYVATEYATYGNLLNMLRKSRCLETDPTFAKQINSMSTYDSEQLLQFAADVSIGMKHLSEKGCVHRDLAARNILVYDNYVAKVADFGLSRGDEVYVKMTAGRLPVRWMAIESLNYSVYTTKSDVWSFGILLWEIITLGGTPYPGLTCAELYQQLPRGYRMPKPLNCDNEVYELMRHCWRERPYDRPDFGQIYIALKRLIQDKKPYVNMSVDDKFKYVDINSTEEAEHASKATANEPAERDRLLSGEACAPGSAEC